MRHDSNVTISRRNRRNFLKTSLVAAGAAAVGVGLLEHSAPAAAQSNSLTAGDAAILQFLAAGELLEVDFWTQYNELGGPHLNSRSIFTMQSIPSVMLYATEFCPAVLLIAGTYIFESAVEAAKPVTLEMLNEE